MSHGYNSIVSTVLNEQGFPLHVIEDTLTYFDNNGVEAVATELST